MIQLTQSPKYRRDIDGLRAIAVIAVIVFHFGHLPNGYLGVDVFFVISGYLITGIICREIGEGRFSIVEFYLKRTRRILPLAMFVCLIALVVGMIVMLPDDLENLAQSVVATNFFSNNILQAVTTKNYWDVVNEYKPLMHTWSLGVEEQYYLVYPFLLLLLMKIRRSLALAAISICTVASLSLYLAPFHQEFEKFYLIFFRFWELAAGGIVAIALRGRAINYKCTAVPVLLLIGLLCANLTFIPEPATLIAVVLLTTVILASAVRENSWSSYLLENRILVAIGKISFSLYMWHQVLLAYARYFWVQELSFAHLLILFLFMFVLSVLSYLLIEQPFRDRNVVKTRVLLPALGFVFLLTSISSLYIYTRGGVIRDIPELGIRRSEGGRNIHAKYNARIYEYDRNFTSHTKIRVLIVGNSFARDWGNVLMESKYGESMEISYIYDPEKHDDLRIRVNMADFIFYSTPKSGVVEALGIPKNKLWAVGTKNFGISNGIFYNRKGGGYYSQRTYMEEGYLATNEKLRQEWGDKYIDYIKKVIDESQRVPVFTPSSKYISQDCRHFTEAGAQYFAQLLEAELSAIFKSAT